ncbi:MAG: phospholipid carrier-dependent glycosyltransferase [Oscillospiraceae bacterium]|nr:phospholipid carrier-dependent glycosyltransferase [Oscillospiraceae bacterium]
MYILEYIKNLYVDLNPVMIFPFITGLYLILFFNYYIKSLQPTPDTAEWIEMEKETPKLSFLTGRHPMTKNDVVPLIILTAIFLFLATFNLGDTNIVDITNEIQSPSENRTHLDNIYFDEIYFVRTAVEHIENLHPYEISHPPLGKEIIAASILTFGMSPLGWRLLGAIIGVLMLVVMYIFIKNMFGKTIIAVCGTLLLGFDFMRFVQTRIATIDTYAVTFILLTFFFMYRYITTDPDAEFRKSLAPLALSGIFFGLGFATKWIGFYAGAGVFVLYVIRLFQLGLHYSTTEKPDFGKYLIKTLLYSFLFFVIIPVIVYYLTYIPYGYARGWSLGGGMLWDTDYFNLVWSNQVSMFTYHSRLVAEHPFSSVWWQWIFNIRPILYVNNYLGDARAAFGAFGNPVVWWGGLLAVIMAVFRVFTHRDEKALIIVIGYLSQLLPWVAVTRIVFAYHYFSSTLFLVLALALVFDTIIERQKNNAGKYAVFGYTVVTGTIFAIFFPMLSGMYIPRWYYSSFIKWFHTWPF